MEKRQNKNGFLGIPNETILQLEIVLKTIFIKHRVSTSISICRNVNQFEMYISRKSTPLRKNLHKITN
jgi:hypothetical protein